MEAQTRPKYNEFLKQWSHNNHVTSFFGSDKSDFLKDWNAVKMGAAKIHEPVVEKKLDSAFVREQESKVRKIEGDYYLQFYLTKVSTAPYLKKKAIQYKWLPTTNPSKLKTKYKDTIAEMKKNPELAKELDKYSGKTWDRDLESDENLNEQATYIIDYIKKMTKKNIIDRFEDVVRRVLENYFPEMVRRIFPGK